MQYLDGSSVSLVIIGRVSSCTVDTCTAVCLRPEVYFSGLCPVTELTRVLSALLCRRMLHAGLMVLEQFIVGRALAPQSCVQRQRPTCLYMQHAVNQGLYAYCHQFAMTRHLDTARQQDGVRAQGLRYPCCPCSDDEKAYLCAMVHAEHLKASDS